MQNIVVVQFSEYVQTNFDKRYNLTCYFQGPGEAVVTSGYISARYISSSISLACETGHSTHTIFNQFDLSEISTLSFI